MTVTLSPVDGSSGVAKTQYRVAGTTSWTDATYNLFTVAAPADHSNDGTHVYNNQAVVHADIYAPGKRADYHRTIAAEAVAPAPIEPSAVVLNSAPVEAITWTPAGIATSATVGAKVLKMTEVSADWAPSLLNPNAR